MTSFVEPILTPNPKRFVIYPIQHDGIWAEFKRQEASFWTAEEIDLSQDMIDWQKLSDDERHFIKHVLAPAILLIQKTLCQTYPHFFMDFF